MVLNARVVKLKVDTLSPLPITVSNITRLVGLVTNLILTHAPLGLQQTLIVLLESVSYLVEDRFVVRGVDDQRKAVKHVGSRQQTVHGLHEPLLEEVTGLVVSSVKDVMLCTVCTNYVISGTMLLATVDVSPVMVGSVSMAIRAMPAVGGLVLSDPSDVDELSEDIIVGHSTILHPLVD